MIYAFIVTLNTFFIAVSNPTSALGLLSGEDVELIEFRPPPLQFGFDMEISAVLYTPPTVELRISFGVTVTVEYALVLDSKGIRQAVQEKNPLKALNSFAIRDIIDGVDSPLIVFEARVGVAIEVSAAIVKVGASGAVTIRVEIDLYDPFPETSNGLVRPFELLALGTTPLDWFEITLTITVDLSVYIKVGIYIGFIDITIFELRKDFRFVILGPLKYTPSVSEFCCII